MANKSKLKDSFKGKESRLFAEIRKLKKTIGEYKAERKESWKAFKNVTKRNLAKIEKSLMLITTGIKKK